MTAVFLDPPAGDLLAIEVTGAGPAVRLTVAGEVDSSTAPALRSALEAALTGGAAEVVVDLGAVTFLDSAGLCVLACGHRRATERAVRLRVLACARAVIRPLQITGLYDLLAVEVVEPGADRAV